MSVKYFCHAIFSLGALLLLSQLLVACEHQRRAATAMDRTADVSAICLAICHR